MRNVGGSKKKRKKRGAKEKSEGRNRGMKGKEWR
jgi:hypothetical protein